MPGTSPSNDIKRARANASDFNGTFFSGLPYFQTYRAKPPQIAHKTRTVTPRYTARFWITHHSSWKWLTLPVDITLFGNVKEASGRANVAKHRLTHGLVVFNTRFVDVFGRLLRDHLT